VAPSLPGELLAQAGLKLAEGADAALSHERLASLVERVSEVAAAPRGSLEE